MGNIDSKSNCTGGISGKNTGTINYCNNSGIVNSTGFSGTGGIVGYQAHNANAITSSCYNVAEITGVVSAGGIIGDNETGKVSNCYNIANINGNSGKKVGIVGSNGANGTIQNSYFLFGHTTTLYATNSGTIDSLSGSKTETEMKSAAFVTTLNSGGTFFKADYAGANSINNGFPILTWE